MTNRRKAKIQHQGDGCCGVKGCNQEDTKVHYYWYCKKLDDWKALWAAEELHLQGRPGEIKRIEATNIWMGTMVQQLQQEFRETNGEDLSGEEALCAVTHGIWAEESIVQCGKDKEERQAKMMKFIRELKQEWWKGKQEVTVEEAEKAVVRKRMATMGRREREEQAEWQPSGRGSRKSNHKRKTVETQKATCRKGRVDPNCKQKQPLGWM
jgi:hypothetical protein